MPQNTFDRGKNPDPPTFIENLRHADPQSRRARPDAHQGTVREGSRAPSTVLMIDGGTLNQSFSDAIDLYHPVLTVSSRRFYVG